MAMGTNDQWEAATMGYQNIGPNYWKGEEGRLALIKGEQKLTDDAWVAPFREIARWKDYLGDGFEAQTYPDSQNLFTLGRAADLPGRLLGDRALRAPRSPSAFEMGAFPPPVPAEGDDCYISDHVDIAIGMNAATAERRRGQGLPRVGRLARVRPALRQRAARLLPAADAPVTLEDPLAQEFVSWRETCKSTIRSTYQILSRGTPNLENETWNASANVIRGTETPEAAAAAPPGRPRLLVRAAEELTPACRLAPPDRGRGIFPSVRTFLTFVGTHRIGGANDPEPHHQQGPDDDPGRGAQGPRPQGGRPRHLPHRGRAGGDDPRRTGRRPLRDLHRVGQPGRTEGYANF